MVTARMLAVHIVYARKAGIDETAAQTTWHLGRNRPTRRRHDYRAGLFEFFLLCLIHAVSENEAIYKVFGLVHFSWNELWRVAIVNL